MSEPACFVGVDVGGTHTDVAVAIGDRVERGKALTTYDDFSRGVLEAVAVAAGQFGIGLDELLGRTQLFINSTTVVTNAITELRGSRVGVLVTAGFADVLHLAGGARLAEFDDHLQVNVPDLTSRAAIAEIEERTDYAGEVLVAVDAEQVASECRRLVEEVGVEALAICFLSSFANGANELAAERTVRDLYPDLFVTVSHRVFPVAGETRRWTTALLNSFVQAQAEAYLESLNGKLRQAGLNGGLAFFQGLGGGVSLAKAKEYPLALLGSGPAAGAIGANELAKRMGYANVLLGDMGGTSFDTGIVNDNRIAIEKSLELGPFLTGINVVDVVSVGAGGGSIASVGERGVPQVGPRSAGSMPGPAALGRGGEEPTVTDAMVAMGFIDPDRYLGGRVRLQPELAGAALERGLGARFGWSADEAAAAVHDLVVANMANAVREVSVEKGHDPREFLFVAYGGTLPLFASQIAERLHMETIVIPRNSSVFSALGLLAADFVLRTDQSVGWDLSRPEDVGRVNAIAERMVARGRAEMAAEGFAEDAIRTQRSADFRFQGQAYELAMPVPERALAPADAAGLADAFRRLYERTYGEGTAWAGVPTTMANYSVTVVGRRTPPQIGPAAAEAAAGDLVRGHRDVYLPSSRRRERVAVYDEGRIRPGAGIEGPALIDAGDTTIFVPPETSAGRDEHMNFVLSRGGAR
ncbi:MAG TPA: hydantoinase/oxoprolinase family protein [Solirubrobacterales bacterium]|jgi:N-methylhydantoinase A|nr:hydantoinase/oxoprolinase family protein [Solirubrobacterales bacterium]